MDGCHQLLVPDRRRRRFGERERNGELRGGRKHGSGENRFFDHRGKGVSRGASRGGARNSGLFPESRFGDLLSIRRDRERGCVGNIDDCFLDSRQQLQLDHRSEGRIRRGKQIRRLCGGGQ